MRFSQFAGTSIVPLLARLVLAFVFIAAGHNKIQKEQEFNAQDAAVLQGFDVTLTPISGPASDADPDASSQVRSEEGGAMSSGGALLVSWNPSPQDEEGSEDDGADDAAVEEAAPAESDTASAATPPAPLDGPRIARRLHANTLLLHDQHPQLPRPHMVAWAIAITEIVGGCMLLLGLFSRFWGFCLAASLGLSFYLISMNVNGIHTTNPLNFSDQTHAFTVAGWQLGLFVLSLGICMTGAGPLSLDRLLFGGKGGGEDDD